MGDREIDRGVAHLCSAAMVAHGLFAGLWHSEVQLSVTNRRRLVRYYNLQHITQQLDKIWNKRDGHWCVKHLKGGKGEGASTEKGRGDTKLLLA